MVDPSGNSAQKLAKDCEQLDKKMLSIVDQLEAHDVKSTDKLVDQDGR